MVRAYLAHKAAAQALHEALNADARSEWEDNGSAPTWRLIFATVSASLSHDRVVIEDRERFMAWMKGRYPTEVVEKCHLTTRSQEWLDRLLENMAGMVEPVPGKPGEYRVVDSEGSEVPGVTFAPGGAYQSVSVTPLPATRRAIAAAATAYARGVDPNALDTIIRPAVEGSDAETDS
jgi:hypothetical protein